MSNPYQPPNNQAAVESSPDAVPAKSSKVILFSITILGVAWYSFAAYMLISQFFGIDDHMDQVPPMARPSIRANAVSSYILGQTAIAGAIACVLAALLARRNRIAMGWWIVGGFTMFFVLLAVVLKPT